MLSAEKQVHLNVGAEDFRHLGKRSRLLDYYWEYDWHSCFGEVAPGKPYTITKTDDEFVRRHNDWERKVEETRVEISSLGSEGFIRDVLGERYDLIDKLTGLKLARGANGEELGYGHFVREYQARTCAPPTATGPLARLNANYTVTGRPSAACPKRKAGQVLDQENIPPAAKRTITIDLCSDDDEDCDA